MDSLIRPFFLVKKVVKNSFNVVPENFTQETFDYW